MNISGFQNKSILLKLQNDKNWELFEFNEVLIDDTKNAKKIKNSDYMDNGEFPIIDQGKDYIAGYTNNEFGIYKNTPYLAFGDHTKTFKYVDFPAYIGADGVKILNLNEKKCNVRIRYLYYFLKTIKLPDSGYSRYFKYLKQVIIPIPRIETQDKIIQILDKSSILIEKRRYQIKLLDKLIDGIFYDMFGDPITNNRKWEICDIESIASYLKRGKTPEYVITSDVKIVNQKCIYWRRFEKENCKFHKINKNIENYLLKNGDILINSTGTGTLGRAVVMKNIENEMYVADGHVTVMKVYKDRANPRYIEALIKSKNIQSEIYRKCVSGSTNQIELSSTKLGKFKIMRPPVELQNQFAEIVNKIEKEKELLKESLEHLEINFKALEQKAFNGELLN